MESNILNDYGRDNIEEIEKAIRRENKDNTRLKRTHTLIQTNSSRNVEVTDESREECTRVLLR